VPVAKVVGYVMCYLDAYDENRAFEIWTKLNELSLTLLDDKLFISPDIADVTAIYRSHALAQRVWRAYTLNPALFVDPRFHKLVQDRNLNEDRLHYCLKEIAPLIASADHRPLHKLIRFSKHDWKFLGVNDVGFATLLPWLAEENFGADPMAESDNLIVADSTDALPSNGKA
jgi:hypothetical protein